LRKHRNKVDLFPKSYFRAPQTLIFGASVRPIRST
jgi:hypothetical protein